jgi:hypothetical protein
MKKIIMRKSKKTVSNEKGQVSVFLAMVMVVIFSLLAFVTNVGLYVKAKINLQNAVDSAAWSGAATQARQLSNIAYLNWEMRNTFKEWMFKYYVIGQMSNSNIHNNHSTSEFRVREFEQTGGSGSCSGADSNCSDRYNIPNICIHFPPSNNVCDIYKIPGLPRFQVAGLPNVSEQFQAAVDNFVTQKSENCSKRSVYNMGAALSYAYSTGIATVTADVPTVATHRVGAWIEAIELAMRIRNLEMVMNRPPVDGPICQDGTPAPGCSVTVSSLVTEGSGDFAHNERSIKAVQAGIKSLNGGSGEMAANFTLTELPMDSINTNPTKTLSGMLIPSGVNHPGGMPVSIKHYVDLVPMVFNYVTYFSLFASSSQNADEIGIGGIQAEGACAGTENAMPVPGYIMGFFKNPQVVTYYAVKGKTKYMGLLNPFTAISNGGIEMSAYSAAKPFGGRIGPMLVNPAPGGGTIHESGLNYIKENDNGMGRSANYALTVDASGDPAASSSNTDIGLMTRLVIPSDTNFYAQSRSEAIGGNPTGAATQVRFLIPNLLYTYPTLGSLSTTDDLPATRYYSYNPDLVPGSANENVGLFNGEQFKQFRSNLAGAGVSVGADSMGQAQIDAALELVRAPTDYEAVNYMIPTVKDGSGGQGDPSAPLEGRPSVKRISNSDPRISYFAPLHGPGTLYQDVNVVKLVMDDYIDANEASINTFLKAVCQFAKNIRDNDNPSNPKYTEAANGICAEDPGMGNPLTDIAQPVGLGSYTDEQCKNQSIASKFAYFFNGDADTPTQGNCWMLPIKNSIQQFIMGQSPLYYTTSFRYHDGASTEVSPLTNVDFNTAYKPGPKDGVDQTSAIFSNPISNAAQYTARRNYYSTKFVKLSFLAPGTVAGETGYNDKNYIENSTNFAQSVKISSGMLNKVRLDISGIKDLFGNEPKH